MMTIRCMGSPESMPADLDGAWHRIAGEVFCAFLSYFSGVAEILPNRGCFKSGRLGF